jgi:putative alpha-1,2-mannosidase
MLSQILYRDAYNTIYPYLSIVNRPQLGVAIQGWLSAFKEGGWLPQWSSPGYRGSMVGTMADVSIAEAIVNKIPGFDVELAYEAIRKDAFIVPTSEDPEGGRQCLSSYMKLGFVPREECNAAVSRSLNYIQSDFAIAQAALSLNKIEDAEILLRRIGNYSSLFDRSTGFIRSLDKESQFSEYFDEFAWGDDYTEAGPWQYRFQLPHDPVGLSDLYREANLNICEEMEKVNTELAVVHNGGYGNPIHEMTEMQEACWGQYAHNNQPIHYLLSMYVAVDPDGYIGRCASRAQYWIRRTCTLLYKPTNDMFPGDEDNGEMGKYVLLFHCTYHPIIHLCMYTYTLCDRSLVSTTSTWIV